MASSDGYNKYDQAHTFAHEPGTVVSPSANRTAGARLLRVHGPYGTRIVNFTATRVGMPPILPAAADTDGDTYVSGSIVSGLPTLNQQDGTFSFRASGRYVYLQDEVRVPGTDPIPSGVYPFSTGTQDYAAYARLKDLSGFDAAVSDPNPSKAMTVLAGANIYDDENPQFGWYLTSLPSQAFTTTLISG